MRANSLSETRLVTPKTVSEMTGLSVKTLANHRWRGDWPLRFVKVGTVSKGARADNRRVLYFLRDVEAFVQSGVRRRTEAL